MSTTNREPSRAPAALVLPTTFAEVLEDRRVLFIGEAAPDDLERLAAGCRSLRVLDTAEGGGKRRSRGYRSSSYRPGALGFHPGAFDAVVVPEIAVLGEEAEERVFDLARIVDGGPLLVGTSSRDGVGYEVLYGWLDEAFEHVRVFGAEPFSGVAVADFEAGESPEVVVDGSLVHAAGAPHGFFAVASDSPLRLAGYTVVRLPPTEEPRPAEVEAPRAVESGRGRAEALEADLAALADSLAERSAELDAARSEARELEKRLSAALRAPQVEPEVTKEHRELEGRLVERAKKIRELEAEVERRGLLVRDAVEEARELRLAGREEPRAIERALSAEAARAEAQFEVDELRGRVRELEEALERCREERPIDRSRGPGPSLGPAPGDAPPVSRLEGRVSGLRLRLENAERALAAASAGARRGEAALDAVDQLRAELAAQKAENGVLTIEVVDLRSETRDLRARAGDTTSALAARDALVTRLQLELSEVEQQGRNAETRASRLAEETASLRAALVDAATAGEAGERALQEAELLRGQLNDLRDRARRLDADRFELEERAERAEHAKGELEERAERAEHAKGELEERLAEKARVQSELEERLAEKARVQSELEERAERAEHAKSGLEERLAEKARVQSELEQKAKRLESEHAALADQVLGLATELAQLDEQRRASAAAEPSKDLQERAERLEAELAEQRSRAAALENERDDARAVLSETRETLESLRAAPAAEPVGGGALEQELKDRDVLLGSLTAQLEERNDRIRALERRLGGSIPAGPPDDELLKRQLLELQERASRLTEELAAERKARREFEVRVEGFERQPDVSAELGRLRDELGRSRQDVDLERGRAEGFERDVRSLRDVCFEARQGLESLLGSATTSGDQTAAERIGHLLTILARY